ncbi:hypothetical protein [Maribacter sp. 2304DJ31-5]|uniref:hypothetical protein n=1 Tax=Maribacter sp. 2304DJ31-5 TaxID=3386273 RepID=UPI0039BCB4A7
MRFFIATQQQLLRIISHSISGFDTPVSHLGIKECIVSIESLKEVYDLTIANSIKRKNPELDNEFRSNIVKAISYIMSNLDFDAFDRYTFIRDCLNPITRNWKEIRDLSGLWTNVDNKPFNFDAPTFFENGSFNINYFAPPTDRNPSNEKIAFGKKLFLNQNWPEMAIWPV